MTASGADIRVYLLTYRRHELLPRAFDSLLRQTYQNWICEVHNDDPNDPFPGELVHRAADPRVIYKPHARNLGPTASFNLAFQPVPEAFISILEDDNWWEPRLLEQLRAVLLGRPETGVVWSNMATWTEQPDGRWIKGAPVMPAGERGECVVVADPDPRQVCGGLHSQGAMLIRAADAPHYVIPDATPPFAMEPLRERLFRRPLVVSTEPLANFAITRATSRNDTADQNLQVLTVLASTWLERHRIPPGFLRQVWLAARGARGHKQRSLIAAAMVSGHLAAMLNAASVFELALVAGWIVRFPHRFWAMLTARRRWRALWEFLAAATPPGARQ